MSSIVPRGGWSPAIETPQPQAAPVHTHAQVIYLQVAARPKSVTGSFFKVLLWVILTPLLMVFLPFGPIILVVLLLVWAVRRGDAKTPTTYRIH